MAVTFQDHYATLGVAKDGAPLKGTRRMLIHLRSLSPRNKTTNPKQKNPHENQIQPPH